MLILNLYSYLSTYKNWITEYWILLSKISSKTFGGLDYLDYLCRIYTITQNNDANMAKKAKVVKEKSIEDRIWDSANKLRGNLTASEYQNVVLGLVFLKYISDCFEKKMSRLTSELGDLFAESHRLEAGIREKLAGIGFNVK